MGKGKWRRFREERGMDMRKGSGKEEGARRGKKGNGIKREKNVRWGWKGGLRGNRREVGGVELEDKVGGKE